MLTSVNMTWVEFIEMPAPGVARLRYHDWQGKASVAVWSLTTLRKTKKCIVTDWFMEPGTKAWRPVGNQNYRMERISELGMGLLIKERDG